MLLLVRAFPVHNCSLVAILCSTYTIFILFVAVYLCYLLYVYYLLMMPDARVTARPRHTGHLGQEELIIPHCFKLRHGILFPNYRLGKESVS